MTAWLRTCVTLGALLAARAWADEPTGEPVPAARKSPRAIGDHIFQPSRLVVGPFATTSFGMATSFGSGTATSPRYDIGGNQIGTRQSDIAAYGQLIDFHARITKDIGVRAEVNGLVFTGTSARDLISAGATTQFGFALGFTGGWKLNPRMRLAFVVDGSLEPQLSVLIGNAIINAIQTGIFGSEGLTADVRRVRLTPGVSFAWAPNPVLGFIAEARYEYAHILNESSDSGGNTNAHGVSLAALASLDLEPMLHWPIAVQGGYRGDLPVTSQEGRITEVHQAGLGVYYSRRAPLALGLEALWRMGQIRPGVTPQLKSDAVIGTLWLRYYW